MNARVATILRYLAITVASVALVLFLLLSAVALVLATNGGSRWAVDQIVALSGVDQQLSFERMEGTLLQGLDLHTVKFEQGPDSLRLSRLHSRWNPYTLLSGEFSLQALHLEGLTVDWPGTGEAAEPGQPLSRTLEALLPLPINLGLDDFRLDDADLAVAGGQWRIDSLHFSASLAGTQASLRALQLQTPELELEGRVALTLRVPFAADGELNWAYQLPASAPVDNAAGQLQLDGNLNAIELTHHLTAPMQAQSSGSIRLGLADLLDGGDMGDIELALEHTLPDQTLPLDGLRDYRIRAAQLRTEGAPQTLTIAGNAEVSAPVLPDGPLEARLQWQSQLTGSGVAVQSSSVTTASGSLSANGSVDWAEGTRLDLELAVEEDNPATYWSGFPDAVQLENLTSSGQLQLRLAGDGPQGELALSSLQGRLNGHDLDGALRLLVDGDSLEVPELRLAAGDNELRASASRGETLSAQLEIDAPGLDAFYPGLSGGLQASFEASGDDVDSLTRLQLTGQADNLAYQGSRLEQLRFSAQRQSRRIDIQLEADNFEQEGLARSIDALVLGVDGTTSEHRLAVSLASAGEQLDFEAAGGWDGDAWQGQLEGGDIRSQLAGRWQQEQAAALSLTAAGAAELQPYCWQQQTSRLCLQASIDQAQNLDASLELERYPLAVINSSGGQTLLNEIGDNEAVEREVNLPWRMADNAAVTGNLSVSAAVSGSLQGGMDTLDIDADLQADDGSIYLRSTPTAMETETETETEAPAGPAFERLRWQNVSLQASHRQGRWQLQGNSDFFQEDLAETGIALRGNAGTQITLAPGGGLDGSLELDFDSISWMEAFVPQVQNSQGQLAARVDLGGNLESPAVTGNLQLREAALDVPPLGISVADLEAELISESMGEASLEGSATSGEGRLQLTGTVESALSPSRSARITLQGERFLLADTEQLTLRLTPDLEFNASASGIQANGNVHVPLLDARIETLPEAAVGVSNDTVIVSESGDEHADTAAGEAVPSDVPVSGRVRLTLGDEVHFTGFGLTGRLIGALDINQRPDSSPLTYGELELVDGQFETYGQRLTIDQGKLLFFGSYENPAIDIRAVRDVEDVQVGVQMNGTLRNIRSRLFSSPTLPDGDILAMLITGRRLGDTASQNEQDNNAMIGAVARLGINQGQALTDQIRGELGLDTLSIETTRNLEDSNLTLGKYITPRIFIRYDVGLFQSQNTLAIDYRINNNLHLEARSGQTQSLDMTYTIER